VEYDVLVVFIYSCGIPVPVFCMKYFIQGTIEDIEGTGFDIT